MKPARSVNVKYRNSTKAVNVDLAGRADDDALAQLSAAALTAFNLVLPASAHVHFVAKGGRRLVAQLPATPAAAKAVRHISELVDGDTVMMVASEGVNAGPKNAAAVGEAEHEARHVSDDALSSAEVRHLLKCCTAVTLPSTQLRQPRFVYGYFRETEGDDAPVFPVCGPCAHTCFDTKHIYVMDRPAVLERPFHCACSTVLSGEHECFWAKDPALGRLNAAEQRQLAAAWAAEHRIFVDDISEQLESQGRDKERKALESLTSRLRGEVDLFEQFHDDDALQAARVVVPMSALDQRARAEVARATSSELNAITASSDESSASPVARLHLELLRQLVEWFYRDFFEWVNNPSCTGCDSPRTEPVPKSEEVATPTPEERSNWAQSVELYKCRDCGAKVRFPRYQRAKRLLTFRRGRCGEFALCFTLCASALGYECRLVASLADQAWVEVYSTYHNRWLHCDPSKGLLDSPLTYERTSSKKHAYVFSVSSREVVDVSRRYSSNPLKHLWPKRDTMCEPAVSKLVRGMDRAQGLRVPKESLAYHEKRQRTEMCELSRPIAVEEAALSIVNGPALDPDDLATVLAFEVNETASSPASSLGYVMEKDNFSLSEGNTPPTNDSVDTTKWKRMEHAGFFMSEGGLTFTDSLRSYVLRPEGRDGVVLPIPKRGSVFTPHVQLDCAMTLQRFPVDAKISRFNSLFGSALVLTTTWDHKASNVVVTLAYPSTKPVSEHRNLGGSAPIVSASAAHAAVLRVTLPFAAASSHDGQTSAVRVGFRLDAFGALSLAIAPKTFDAAQPIRPSQFDSVLAPIHALREEALTSDVPLTITGIGIMIGSLCVASTPETLTP
jgi:hypothetical protein